MFSGKIKTKPFRVCLSRNQAPRHSSPSISHNHINNTSNNALPAPSTLSNDILTSQHQYTSPLYRHMSQSPAINAALPPEPVSSHPISLIDQIESILTSPSSFTTHSATDLLPLLDQLQLSEEDDDEAQERIIKIVKWCEQLDDAVRAAHARETITTYLKQVTSWPEWTYSISTEAVEEMKGRIERIKKGLAELPIEWLKIRVTGIIPSVCVVCLGESVDGRITQTRRRITPPGILNYPYHFLTASTSVNALSTPPSLHDPLPCL